MEPLTVLFVDLSCIVSFDSVLRQLLLLDGQLEQNHLHQFVAFNKAYFVVTSSIKQAFEDDHFENPKFIETFTVAFSRYYFQAINDSARSNPRMAVAWSKMNTINRAGITPSFIPLLMGANAHINHDLPIVLLASMQESEADGLLKDIVKLDHLLMKSGREIIRTFVEPNKLLDTVRRRFQFLYYRPVMYVILRWRINAWRSYKSLRKGSKNKEKYVARSAKIATHLLSMGRHLPS